MGTALALANGQVYAWGGNGYGELGTGSNTGSNVPVAVSTAGVLGGHTVTAIAAGYIGSLAVADGQVYAWGANAVGELGNGTTNNSNAPVGVSTAGVLGGKTVTAVAGGGYHNLAVANGQVFDWGANPDGELGNGSTTPSDVPVAVASSPRVFHGSIAPRSSISTPSKTAVPMRGKRNSVKGSSQLVSKAMPCSRRSAVTVAMS